MFYLIHSPTALGRTKGGVGWCGVCAVDRATLHLPTTKTRSIFFNWPGFVMMGKDRRCSMTYIPKNRCEINVAQHTRGYNRGIGYYVSVFCVLVTSYDKQDI